MCPPACWGPLGFTWEGLGEVTSRPRYRIISSVSVISLPSCISAGTPQMALCSEPAPLEKVTMPEQMGQPYWGQASLE